MKQKHPKPWKSTLLCLASVFCHKNIVKFSKELDFWRIQSETKCCRILIYFVRGFFGGEEHYHICTLRKKIEAPAGVYGDKFLQNPNTELLTIGFFQGMGKWILWTSLIDFWEMILRPLHYFFPLSLVLVSLCSFSSVYIPLCTRIQPYFGTILINSCIASKKEARICPPRNTIG